jgi:hypothetical protein
MAAWKSSIAGGEPQMETTSGNISKNHGVSDGNINQAWISQRRYVCHNFVQQIKLVTSPVLDVANSP